MKWQLYLAFCLALVIMVIGTTGCDVVGSPAPRTTSTGGSTNQQYTGIWVSGTGEVTVTPDIAILEVGVEIQEPTVTEAQAIASATMEKITTALTDSGVKKEDIQTRYFRIWQQTRRDNFTDQETITGYRVTNMVTAKIREIENAGNIIDKVLEADEHRRNIQKNQDSKQAELNTLSKEIGILIREKKDKQAQIIREKTLKLKEEIKELNKKITELEIESRTSIELLKEEIEDNQRVIKEKEEKEKQIVQMLNNQFKELLYLKPETVEARRDVESVIKTAIELGDDTERITDSLVQAGYKKEEIKKIIRKLT